MRKKMKLILSIILIVVVLVVSYIILIIKGILPNPFLDTSELVCVRTSNASGNSLETELVTISFDKSAKIKILKEELLIEFDIVEEAQEYYDEFIMYLGEDTLFLEGNKVSSYSIVKIDKDNNYFDKTKEEMKKIYIKEYQYECE